MFGRALNLAAPVVLEHPHNKGLAAEYAVVPGYSGGGVLRDLLGKNHGTLVNGPAWAGAAGRPGGYGALSFDGVDDYAEMSSGLPNDASFSAACWIKAAAVTTTYTALFDGGNLGSGTLGWTLAYDGSGKPFFAVNAGFQTASVALAVGVWTHVCGVWVQGAGVKPLLYINGLPDAGGSSGTASGFTNYGTVRVAHNARSAAFGHFAGLADGAPIYGRALSDAEVWALCTGSRLGNPSRGHWLSRRAWVGAGAAAGFAPKFRKSLSGIGGRVGQRQAQGVG